MLAEYLAGESFEVLEAGSGEEALPEVSTWQPDLVLLDLMMAGIGGLEALRRIKALRPETCVIMVTAVDDLDVARSALAAGAADYVTKPFTFQYLDAVLDIHVPAEPAHVLLEEDAGSSGSHESSPRNATVAAPPDPA